MWQWIPAKWRRSSRDDARDRGERGAVVEPEAELGVLGAGLDELVRVRFDAGRDAHVHAGVDPDGRREPRDAIELVERVDDDAADAGFERARAARRRTCCCRGTRCAPAGSPRAARRTARRRSRRRGRDPPRRRAAPSRRTGTPCSRTPRPRRTPPRTRGTARAARPRRTRRAAYRSVRPARPGRRRRARPGRRRRPSPRRGSSVRSNGALVVMPSCVGFGIVSSSRRAISSGACTPRIAERVGEADPARFRQPQPGLGRARRRR